MAGFMTEPEIGREYKSRLNFAMHKSNKLIVETWNIEDRSGVNGAAAVISCVAYPLTLLSNYLISFGGLRKTGAVYKEISIFD